MRDHRFIAVHRGGSLSRESHGLLACWAADCAARVGHLFTRSSSDLRPLQALEIARAWADGAVKTGVAMKAALGAHSAARSVVDKAAIAAARAAGHAVATAHCADHCMGAVLYGQKAMHAAGIPAEEELEWQLAQLRPDLRPMIIAGLEGRLSKPSFRPPVSR